MPLKDALSECLDEDPIAIPDTRSETIPDPEFHTRLVSRIQEVLTQLRMIEQSSEETIKLNKEAQALVGSPEQVDRRILSMHAIRDRVLAQQPAFDMVNFFNQRGGLNRFKVDREIKLLTGLSPEEKMAKQLERDAHNVAWIRESASEVSELLSRALGVIEGTASPMTRDEFADEEPSVSVETQKESAEPSTLRRRVEAVIFADTEIGPLGNPRDLNLPIYQELNALQLTVARLGNAAEIDGVTIITPQVDVVESMIPDETRGSVRVVSVDQDLLRSRIQSIGAARAASSECWRGSIGSLGCYDEGFVPSALVRVMDEFGIDAAAIVGPDWAMVDPVLVDRIVARHRALPEQCHVPFSQAIPGIGCSVLDRGAVEALCKASEVSSTFGSIGAMFGYIPVAPQGDPIASPLCVGVDPAIRDAGVRAVADSPARRGAMSALFNGLGDSLGSMDSSALILGYARELERLESRAPCRIELELTTDRKTGGVWGAMHDCQSASEEITLDQATDLFQEALSLRPECSLLLAGRGDPLARTDAMSFVAHAKELGFSSVELRTDLFDDAHTPEQIVGSGVDVVSVDVLANTNTVYAEMTGSDSFESFLDRMQTLFNARSPIPEHMPAPWIVPRITRSDASYSDIQGFYDRWLTVCGCAIIDPNPKTGPEDRIQPLPVPKGRARLMERDTLRIRCDGRVVDHQGRAIPGINVFEVGVERAFQAFRHSLDHQTTQHIEPKSSHEPMTAS